MLYQAAIAIALAILPPCEHEDSDMCYWDATTRGNGWGLSYVSTTNGHFHPYYWTDQADAK